MKIAVLSDVHGFSPALQDVLDHIRTHDVDQIIAAGDLCDGGPDPAGSIQLLRERNCNAVYGNTDRNILQMDNQSDAGTVWTRQQLSREDLDWLDSLPFSIQIPHPAGAPGSDESDLLVVHANPTDVDRHLSPNASDGELLQIIGDESARTIAFGHLHVAYTRQVGQYSLVDVSAVGNPKDHDLRPRYAIFNSRVDAADWTYEYHYLDYPLERTRALMEQSDMPGWQKAWTQLNEAGYRRKI